MVTSHAQQLLLPISATSQISINGYILSCYPLTGKKFCSSLKETSCSEYDKFRQILLNVLCSEFVWLLNVILFSRIKGHVWECQIMPHLPVVTQIQLRNAWLGCFCYFSQSILEGWFQNIKSSGRSPKYFVNRFFLNTSVFLMKVSLCMYYTNSLKLINASLLIWPAFTI